MSYQIIEVDFPHNEVRAAAAQNKDGTYTIYVNALYSKAEQDAYVRAFIAAIENGGAV